MILTVEIKTCWDCYHHIYVSQKNRTICEHPDRKKEKTIDRIVTKISEIPSWCPLKHGSCY